MADKNALLERNAGQRHYEETVNNTGSNARTTWSPRGRRRVPRTSNYHDQTTDYRDRMSYTDNSQPTSSLRDYEPTESQWNDFYNDIGYDNNDTQSSEATTSQSGDTFLDNSADKAAESSRDLATREREASQEFNSEGFNSSSKANTKPKPKISKFKAVSAGLGLLCFAGLALAGFTAISGPMQVIQAASMVKDFLLNITDWQQTTRSLKNSKSIVKDLASDSVKTTKLGKYATKQAEKMEESLAAKGLTFTDSGMTISVGSESQARQIAKSIGVDVSEESLVKGVINLSDDISYSTAKKAISAVDDVGNSKIASWLQTRWTLKKNGYISWLHPFQKLKQKAYNLLEDFISDMVGKINKTDSTSKRIDEGQDDQEEAEKENRKTTDSDGKETYPTNEEMEAEKSANSSKFDDAANAASDAAKKTTSKTRGALARFMDKYDNVVSLGGVLNNPGVNAATMIVSVVCMIQTMSNAIGPYKMANIVNVAIKATSLLQGFSSQIKSGEDIDMDQVGMAVKMMLGDTQNEIDENGNATSETYYSTAWCNPTVTTTLGTVGCNTDSSAVPDTLKGAGSGAFGSSSALTYALAEFFDYNTLAGKFLQTICFINDVIGAIDVIGTAIGAVISNLGSASLGGLMSSFMGLVMGTPLDLENASPLVWGAIIMYGGKFLSNDQALGTGGRKLSSQEAIELNLENRRFLAWQNNQKSLVARLVDPSDYNSSLNQIARAAQLNTSDQNLTTQLANVFKMFTSAPTILATATNQLIGGNAYAASTYDYGVSSWGYSMSEVEDLNSNNSYSLYNNTETALSLLPAEVSPQIKSLKSKLNTEDNSDSDNQSVANTVHNIFNDYVADIDSLLETSYGSVPADDNGRRYAMQCLGVYIGGESEGYAVEELDNDDGERWNYLENGNSTWCSNNATTYKSIRIYVMDYFNTVSGMCYYSDEGDSDGTSACNEMGISGSSSSSSSGISQDAEELQKAFAATGGVQTISGGYTFNVCSNGCTTIPAWYIMNYTTGLNYQGRGNGRDVVRYLVEDNPDLEESSTPRAPAIFSTSSWHSQTMCGGSLCGHTGLVTDVADDGTLTVLETGSGRCNEELKSAITQVPKSEWEGNMTFVYLGDHLK